MTLRATDVVRTYEYASAVAHIVLNLQEVDFEELVPPPIMKPRENLFAGFRASRDFGFAYAVICQAASQWKEGCEVAEWLDEALGRVGLAPAVAIYAAAHEKIESAKGTSDGGMLDIAENYLLSLGPKINALRSAGDTALTPSRIAGEQLTVPPLFDPEGRTIDIASGRFDRGLFPLDELHQQADSLHNWTQNFPDECR